MINRIIDFSIRNKFLIGLFMVGWIGMGIWSMQKVPIDATPDITNNQVQVITQAPNLSTEDIEQFVTYPVEVAMSNLPDVKEIRSVSRFGLSVVTIVFKDEAGTYLPRQLVSEKLTKVREEIPEGFGSPMMGPISTGLGEIYQYTLEVEEEYQDKYTITELRSMQDWIIRRQMSLVPGVVEVNAFGGKIKQYEVAINPSQLKAMNITTAEVLRTLKENNQNTGGAYIEKNHQANFIRGEGLASNPTDIEKMLIKTRNGIPVTIKDVAEVKIGHAVRYGALTKDGKGETVGGMILMLKGANSNEVIERVKKRMEQIQKSLPDGVYVEPFLDRSDLIANTTSTVKNNLLEGGLIVIFVLVLLLGNWRGGLIVASTIPLALLFAFILMNVFDVWANLMSLGAIDFGIIVDGAVIIVESTVFYLFAYTQKNKRPNREKRNEITAKSSKKMMNAAFFGQLIIVLVFIPILALEGIEGKMFQPMALTFIFAMLGAMILCLTYVPMMSALLITVKSGKSKKTNWGDRFVKWVEKNYAKALTKSLKHGKAILASAVVIFGLAVFTFMQLGGEFIPQLDEGDIAFHIMPKSGSSLSETIATTTKAEQIILSKYPEVKSVISRIGVAEVPTDPMPMDIADTFIIYKDNFEWTSAKNKVDFLEKVKKDLSVLPGVSYEFTQPIEMRFNELLTGVREDVAIKLFGDDLELLAAKAEEMGKIISTVDGVGDLKVEATAGLPQISIEYNRNKLAQYGLQISKLNQLVQTAFAGSKAGVIFEGERKFDLVVRLQENQRKDIKNVENLFVNLPNGNQIPLREVANIHYEPGPMQISRDNTNRRTYVGINIRNRDVESVVKDIQQKLDAELDLPPGYYIRYGGAFENLERASNRLQTVVPIALVLIFILIYLALRSFTQTLMIYLAIPMATIGGVFSLYLRDMPFSISAGVGFIVLFGVAVLNGLVLISGLNELKQEKQMSLKNRILQGTKRRVRPIMLTALTDILGFLPMAISTSSGAEVQRPLATVVIGGLITSTLLTLFVLPILYKWLEKQREKRADRIPKNTVLAGLVVLVSFLPFATQAQEIPTQQLSMEEAVEKAVENYPLLKNKELAINQSQAAKKEVWDLGTTKVFTGGEELTDGKGTYTIIGLGQEKIDLFGIAAKNKLAKAQIALAKQQKNLSELELQKSVQLAWSNVYVAKKKYHLISRLDSVYQKFKQAIDLQYNVEAISKLKYISANNQALQIALQKRQAQDDYTIALENFNVWLFEDQLYDVSQNLDINQILIQENKTLKEHPALQTAQLQIDAAKADYKAAKADLLPKFNLQYGIQEIRGASGYYSYQAGISLPLLSGAERRRIKTSKIEQQITSNKASLSKKRLQTNYTNALRNFKKWKESWQFYKEEALPLTTQQQSGALLAFREGAIDYTGFIQLIEQANKTELAAIKTLQNYLEAYINLAYFQPEQN
ncbi:CusA/CzcA family heavy metal efflux RND transporter [Haloflavibacter putidus]|uniref:CusA/CzcA family heavy metal efflux RND transporter n=1 Tax=Haloflavibacter putidus TaxID=2576776 RepID=A0A507ZP63_9FLAO|nr:CusA/CzcA family heavy metal efflux RND transporter [Haloflavibacter putidus]TQD35402.1 CusA/CzcA family heavy metal efflux RND transporter [Haloflavibacter putidus]